MQKLMTKELENRFAKVGSQDGKGNDAIVIAHFFIGGSDWWATDYMPEDRCLFGFVCLNGDKEMSELGYFSLQEFEEFNKVKTFHIERDAWWTEKTLGEIKKEGGFY